LAAVEIEPGQKTTVPLKVKRDNCPGAIRIELPDALSEALSGVGINKGQVRAGSSEGSLELYAVADAKPGQRKVRLRAVADAASTEGDLRLTILPKRSLRLLEIAAVKVTAGQTTKVPVKIKRENCPGLVEITLAKEELGVKLLSGLVGKNSEE